MSSDSDLFNQKPLPDEVPKLDLASNLSSDKVQKVFDKLLGYQVNSDIDRKLLYGMFEQPVDNDLKQL